MTDSSPKPHADSIELHARLVELARNQQDPNATRDRILREIVAWIRENTAHSLSPLEIERRAQTEFAQHLLFVQESGNVPQPAATGIAKVGSVVKRSRKLKALVPTKAQEKLLDAGGQIRECAPNSLDKTYLARQLIQATLPHANPKGNPPIWVRKAGNVSLSVRPFLRQDPKTGQYQHLYPYGSIPRLLLFWLTSELIRTKQRRIELGDTLADFMRRIGLDPSHGGPRSDAARLKDQMRRLFGAEICFDLAGPDYDKWHYMRVAPKGELWWDTKRPAQADLWQSWIEVGEDFYEAVRTSPVPVDLRALKALKRSPLALDLYAWCAYHAYIANHRKAAYDITWSQLHLVMGGEYASIKEFARKCKLAFRKIQLVYPSLKLDITKGGFVVRETSGLPVEATRTRLEA